MTRGEILDLLTNEAKQYRRTALSSIERNQHMNNISISDLSHLKKKRQRTQRLIDSILVDFINAVAANQGVDYALYTKDLASDRT